MPRKSNIPTAPLNRFVDLSDLTQAGSLIDVAAKEDELAALAGWADVAAVESFTATVTLKRLSQNRFSLAALLRADVVQSCVVTLEPVCAHIEKAFSRELYCADRRDEAGGELTLAAGDDETPDPISDLHYDLAAPLLEELSLAIDPYPRKPGVNFDVPVADSEKPVSPFAILKSLKKSG
jgi:hypothetical protein